MRTMFTAATLLAAALAFPAAATAHDDPPSPTRAPHCATSPQGCLVVDPSTVLGPTLLRATLARITPPKRGAVMIYDGDQLLYRVVAPTTVPLVAGHTYGVVATRRQAHLWTGALQPVGTSLDVRWRLTPAPLVRQVGASPHEGAAPMGAERLRALLDDLAALDFDHDRLRLVHHVSATERFTVFQVGRILESFGFESDRMRALELLRPTIVDPQYGHALARLFELEADRRQATSSFPRW